MEVTILVISSNRLYSGVLWSISPYIPPMFSISALLKFLFGFDKLVHLDSHCSRRAIDSSFVV